MRTRYWDLQTRWLSAFFLRYSSETELLLLVAAPTWADIVNQRAPTQERITWQKARIELALSVGKEQRAAGTAYLLVPDGPNVRWLMDFVSDQLANGPRFRVLNVVDDFSRECVLQIVDTSISGQRVARTLDQRRRPLPKTIVVDNGPEFSCKAMFFWAKRSKVKLHFTQPGEPTQNAFVESFNGKFRDYCLDLHWFASLEGAREISDTWRDHYNHVRPHRSLGKKPPAVFAQAVA